MDIWCKVTAQGLVPLYDSDYDEKQRLKVGDKVLCHISRPRNYLFHKKFFALIRLVFENLPEHLHAQMGIYSEDDLLTSIKLDLGRATVITYNGVDVVKVGSISFAAMDDTQFEEFYRAAISVILNKYLVGTDREELLEEVANFL